VPAVDGAGRIAVQATAIASKGDQIGHGNVRLILTFGRTLPNGRGSEWDSARLGISGNLSPSCIF
jgi:hypothetical protein